MLKTRCKNYRCRFRRAFAYCKNEKHEATTTIADLINELNRIKLDREKLKVEISKLRYELENYANTFDGYNDKLKRELQSEKTKNFALEQEVERLKLLFENRKNGCLLIIPNLVEWCVGEFSDLIVEMVKLELKHRTPIANRKAEILSAILEVNQTLGESERFFEKVKVDIRKADTTEKLTRVLEDCGFEIISKSPHIKAHFKGNPQYCITVATSSGSNQKEKLISEITKILDAKKYN